MVRLYRETRMIYLREEGEVIRMGINIYPKSSNQLGFVLRVFDSILFVRYNKKQKKCRVSYRGSQ